MTAVDTLIAQLNQYRTAENTQAIVCDVDFIVAAFQQLQTGVVSGGGMKLLGAVLYDPAVQVNKSAAALLAMTALDTVNLRLTVTVPASGFIMVRLQCGGRNSTIPMIFLGVMQGATVIARSAVIPRNEQGCFTEMVIPGLAPGSITLDAAYGVELVGAGANLSYGGPDDAVTNNAAGAFGFSIWDTGHA